MKKESAKQELRNKIEDFCKNKHFEQPFVQECITEFIEGHTNLYGDVISAEDLLKRLENNLDKVTFLGREKAPNGELGEYKGRIADNTDVNEILLYFDEVDLDLSETDKKMWNLYTESDKQHLLDDLQVRKANVKSTLLHELTHAAYTIKDEYGMGEKHIFSNTGKDYLSGEYRQIGGNNNNVEAIINYISNKIEGKEPEEISTYQAETKAIYMLAEKTNEKAIIQSAWNSDEELFKQTYIESIEKNSKAGERSYDEFQMIMQKLVATREQNLNIDKKNLKNKQLLSQLQQTLDGKSYEHESSNFKEIEHTISTDDQLATFMPPKRSKLSFTQNIAKFLEKHEFLRNISIFKKIVAKHFNALPPVKDQDGNGVSPLSSEKNDFFGELLSNVKSNEEPLEITNKEKEDLKEINKPVKEEKRR